MIPRPTGGLGPRLLAGALGLWLTACANGGPAAPSVVRDSIDAPFVALTGGRDYSCGLTARGTVYCWGSNAVVSRAPGPRDRCGKDLDSYECLKTPARVEGLPPLVSLEGDAYHACGLTAVGEAWCWGSGSAGVLGNGDSRTLSQAPVAVLGGLTWRSLSLGSENTCGLTTAGAAYCWGATRSGVIGDGGPAGPNVNLDLPTRVAGPAMSAIAAGFSLGCGVEAGGAALCWGELRDCGLRRCHDVPEPLPGSLRFRALAAGYFHACGIADDGGTYCWGSDTAGELGNGAAGSLAAPETPRRVEASVRFAFVSAAMDATCGLTADGAAYCWGGNYAGRFGDGTMTSSRVPVAAASGLRLKGISLGEHHTCGLTLDGRAYCWGGNDSGQLGNGTDATSTVPVLVSGQPFAG